MTDDEKKHLYNAIDIIYKCICYEFEKYNDESDEVITLEDYLNFYCRSEFSTIDALLDMIYV